MKANDLFYGTDIQYKFGDTDFLGVTSDSRRVRPGYLFICQRGGRHDGHYHWPEAVAKGAATVLAEHPISGIPENMLALTADTRAAEAGIWNNLTGHPAEKMTCIAITGTAGKTSVAFILKHILSSAGHKVGLLSTVCAMAEKRVLSLGENGGSSVSDICGAMTTPDPEYFFGAVAEMRDAGCDTLIYEASSQALLMKKTSPIRTSVAIFTNLSPEHLDCHGDMESYFAAKASLMRSAESAVINIDDPWMARLPQMYPNVRAVRCTAQCSRVADSEVCALRYVSHGAEGLEYVYFSENAVFRLKTQLTGRFSVYNTMEASAAAMLMGVDPMTVKEALTNFRGVDGRMYSVALPEKCGFRVLIDYAHTADSVKRVTEAVREFTSGRLTVVIGCGGDRDRAKRPEMARAAQRLADCTVLTGDNPRSESPETIIADMLGGLDKEKPHAVIPDRREAIKYAINKAEAGDAILLLGKGHEKYEITSDGMHPFDEEATVMEAVKERFG